MRKMRIFLLLSLFYACFLKATAQNHDTIPADTARSKFRVIILPGLSYAPETKLALALTPMIFAQLDNPQTTPVSVVKFPIIYTLNKQILSESYWDIFLPRSRFIIMGKLGFQKYPNRHYGIGNNANEIVVCHKDKMINSDTLNYLNYSNQIFRFQNQILARIYSKFYAGVQWDFERHSDFQEIITEPSSYTVHQINFEKNPMLGQQFGVGFAMRWDSRNHIFTPSKGTFLQLNYYQYQKILNSDFQYFSFNLDYRKFIQIYPNLVLAWQYLHQIRQATQGQKIPFFGLAQAGGQDTQRGYFLGTFRDRNLSSFQIETRLNIWHRIGGVIFGGGTQTYGIANIYNLEKYNFAFGAGFRYVLQKSTGLTMRMDYALGLHPTAGYHHPQRGFYIRLREAF